MLDCRGRVRIWWLDACSCLNLRLSKLGLCLWTQWHLDGLCPSSSLFRCQYLFHRMSALSLASSWGWTRGSVEAAIPQRHDLTPARRKTPLGVNFGVYYRREGCRCEEWIGLAQDRDTWRALVSAVRNLRVT
jgi:hypothetical protein